MLSFAANRSRHTESQAVQPALAVCIVDPQADEYRTAQSAAAARGATVHVVPTAQAALRLSRTQQISLWLVNTELPGLSGYELCGMLKAHNSRAAVCLLANEYTVDAEQAAWQARASMFLCKGSHAEWLSQWLAECSPRSASTTLAPITERD